MSENPNQSKGNSGGEFAQELGTTILENFLPMLGIRWFVRCKTPIMGVIHILLCCIIVPVIVYNVMSGLFAIIGAIIGVFVTGWFLTFVADLYMEYQKGGGKSVIQSLIAIVIIIPLVGWFICKQKADDTSLWSGETKLHKNAQQGDAAFVKFWLFVGATVDKQDSDGETPLYEAAKKGHAEIVKILHNEGADVNKSNKYDSTPLNAAAINGHAEVVKLLIEAGADVNKADKYGSTPLYWANKCGRTEIVELLKAAGAK